MRLPRRFGPLHEREFGLLYAGQAVSLLGDALVPVALAFAVLDLTGSATDLGYVFAAQILPLVVVPARGRRVGRPAAAAARDARLRRRRAASPRRRVAFAAAHRTVRSSGS